MLTPFVLHYADAYAAFRVSELLSLAEVENVELQDADIREWEAAPAVSSFLHDHTGQQGL